MSSAFAWLALVAPLGIVSGAIPADEYQSRRQALAKALPDGVTVVFGRVEKDSDDLRSAFFQEPNFFYLTGWIEPGAVLLIEPREGAPARELIFVPRRNPEREKWTGHKFGPGEDAARAPGGFSKLSSTESLETEIKVALERLPKLYTVSESSTGLLRALAPLRDVGSASLAIARLRMRKSLHEIDLLQHSTDATIAAHFAGLKRAAPGLFEYQIAGAMTAVYFDLGCERSAYAPIVGSGPNGTVLHYSLNSRRMDRGELLLMDVGAECAGYASDVTRTVPVGSTFTRRQREIYDIVLGAQNAVIAEVKPGAVLAKNAPNSLYKVALDYINAHGKDRHGEPLGKYFTHGIGHHVGLEVHDAWDPEQPLEENMVITVEPGIYIPEENIGVRIEDMLLVTKDGARLMSGALPRDPARIEKSIAR